MCWEKRRERRECIFRTWIFVKFLVSSFIGRKMKVRKRKEKNTINQILYSRKGREEGRKEQIHHNKKRKK